MQFELLIHLPVEVVPQEEGPEPEQRVHLPRLTDPQTLPLCKNIDSVTGEHREKAVSSIHRRSLDDHYHQYMW